MLDEPAAPDILAAAILHLREAVLPAVTGRTVFDVRLCLSALELVSREFAAPVDEGERVALRKMLGMDGDLDTLNRALASRIEAEAFAMDDPVLIDHLRRVTLAKLAIDQPSYAGYRRHLSAEA